MEAEAVGDPDYGLAMRLGDAQPEMVQMVEIMVLVDVADLPQMIPLTTHSVVARAMAVAEEAAEVHGMIINMVQV